MTQPHEIPAQGRTSEQELGWLKSIIILLLDRLIAMEKRMNSFEENLARMKRTDTEKKP